MRLCLLIFVMSLASSQAAIVARVPPGHHVASYFEEPRFAHYNAVEFRSFERLKRLGVIREFVLHDFRQGDFYYFRFVHTGQAGTGDFFSPKNYELLLQRKVRIPDYYRAYKFDRTLSALCKLPTVDVHEQWLRYDYFIVSGAGSHGVRIEKPEISVVYDFMVSLADKLIGEISPEDLERFVYRFPNQRE